jgi:hypothetical protein
MRFGVGAVLCLLVLACAPGAQAAMHYASPSGSGKACTTAIPCSLREAALKAWVNDEVIVGAGNYSIGSEPIGVRSGAQNVSIHGDYPGPMPHIDAHVAGGPAIFFEDNGGRLAYLEIVNEAPELAHAASCIFEGIVERVHLVARGPRAVGLLQGPGCSVRDSLMEAYGDGAVALHTTDSETSERTDAFARNVTAIAAGPNSVGVAVQYLGVGSTLLIELLLHNTIASGDSYDLAAICPEPGFGKAILFVGNSNFETSISRSPGFEAPYPPGTLDPPAEIVQDVGNQSAPPLFVNAAAGDFREAAGSPTIDAGQARELGTFDLSGTPRSLGEGPDIGAYEAVPAATPPPPRVVGKITSLKLKPPRFQAIGAGGRARPGQPGTMVSYRLTAPAKVRFVVEHKTVGRLVKGKCRKETRFNDYGRPCSVYLREKPTFSRRGPRGTNRFRFRGRLGREALEPGLYRLVASAGGARRRASFRVVG